MLREVRACEQIVYYREVSTQRRHIVNNFRGRRCKPFDRYTKCDIGKCKTERERDGYLIERLLTLSCHQNRVEDRLPRVAKRETFHSSGDQKHKLVIV